MGVKSLRNQKKSLTVFSSMFWGDSLCSLQIAIKQLLHNFEDLNLKQLSKSCEGRQWVSTISIDAFRQLFIMSSRISRTTERKLLSSNFLTTDVRVKRKLKQWNTRQASQFFIKVWWRYAQELAQNMWYDESYMLWRLMASNLNSIGNLNWLIQTMNPGWIRL